MTITEWIVRGSMLGARGRNKPHICQLGGHAYVIYQDQFIPTLAHLTNGSGAYWVAIERACFHARQWAGRGVRVSS